MRLWYWPLMRDFSGDLGGKGFVVYSDSRDRALRASAAAAMLVEALLFVTGLEDPGLRGRGGGARSGSELSHLCFPKIDVSPMSHLPITRGP